MSHRRGTSWLAIAGLLTVTAVALAFLTVLWPVEPEPNPIHQIVLETEPGTEPMEFQINVQVVPREDPSE